MLPNKLREAAEELTARCAETELADLLIEAAAEIERLTNQGTKS
jgi:hypothetical protein